MLLISRDPASGLAGQARQGPTGRSVNEASKVQFQRGGQIVIANQLTTKNNYRLSAHKVGLWWN